MDLKENYKIGKTIGEGTFGKVKQGINNMTGETVFTNYSGCYKNITKR